MDFYNNILFLLIIISIIILTGIQQKLYEGLEPVKFDPEKHREISRKILMSMNDDDFYKVDYSKCKDEHEQYIETNKKYEVEINNLNKNKKKVADLKVKLTNVKKKGVFSRRRNVRANKIEKIIIEKEVQIEVSMEVINKLEVELLRISTLTERPYCFKIPIIKDNTNVISEDVITEDVISEDVTPTAPGCYVYSEQPCSKKKGTKPKPGEWKKLRGKYTSAKCYSTKEKYNKQCKSNDFKVQFNK